MSDRPTSVPAALASMIESAKRVIPSATHPVEMKPPTSRPPLVAHEIRHFASFAGIPDLAEQVGLDPATLDDPESRVPITVVYDAIELAAARSGLPEFGVRFAAYWTKHAKGGFDSMQFLVRSSPSLRVACDRILRYQRFWNPAEWYGVEEKDGAYTVRYRCWGPPREAHVHQAEKTAAMTALVPRTVDPACRPLAVRFPHARRGDDEKATRLFGVAPTYGAPWTEVVLPIDVLDKPLPDANPGLFGFMDRYLAGEIARLPKGDDSFAQRAFGTVQRLIHDGIFTQDAVARAIGCGSRTLARRLAEEGTSLREIVDTVRKGRAEALLDARTSIAEVAFLLGFSEPAAFQHAFRRWHGTTPKAWLASRAHGPASDGSPIRTAR